MCLNSYRFGVWGASTKMAVSWEPLIQLTLNLDTVYLRVCPTTRWCHFCGDDVTGVCTDAQNIPQVHFLVENKERYNLAFECVLPESLLVS